MGKFPSLARGYSASTRGFVRMRMLASSGARCEFRPTTPVPGLKTESVVGFHHGPASWAIIRDIRPMHRCRRREMMSGDMTTASLSSSASTIEKPEWIRLPSPGARCRHTGLSRSTLNELVIPGSANDGKAPVKSVVLRKRGAVRGIRLISFDSLMAHLDELSRAVS
jgi:hypothetical protein